MPSPSAHYASRFERPGLRTKRAAAVQLLLGYVEWIKLLGGVDREGGYELTGTKLTSSTCTNHRNRGRTSADRSTKATLMLTVPRSLTKSSTKDLT